MDSRVKDRVKEAIEKLPGGNIRKIAAYNHLYRLRVGDYRVLFEMYDDGIFIDDVLPRGQAYKNI